VVRHAAASRAEVSVRRIGEGGEQKLEIKVCDNGKGMGDGDPSKDEHFGLLGIRERAHALAGSLVLTSPPGGGTTINRHPAAASTATGNRGQMSANPIQVMLVDDHAVVRMGFRLLLEALPTSACWQKRQAARRPVE